jgi:ribonuclease Z
MVSSKILKANKSYFAFSQIKFFISRHIYNKKEEKKSSSQLKSLNLSSPSKAIRMNDEKAIKKVKLEKKEDSKSFIPTDLTKISDFNNNKIIYLKVISNGFMESSKSMMLVFETGSRYLFNCGAGIQRLLIHDNLSHTKVKNILTTRMDLDCISGLKSLCIELHEKEIYFNLHTPSNQDIIKNKSIRNLFADKIDISRIRSYEKHKEFIDENLKIRAIELISENENCSGSETPSEKSIVARKYQKDLKLQSFKKVYSYLCTFHEALPKLDEKKLDAYKQVQGPWIKNLIKGMDVKIADGSIIKAKDVLDYENIKENLVLVLDCPNMKYFKFIQECEEINNEKIELIVHFSHSSVLHNPEYLNWIKTFKNKNCLHLYLDETCPEVILESIYEQQAQLNLVNDSIFPLLPLQKENAVKLFCESRLKEKELQKDHKIILGIKGVHLNIRPHMKLDKKSIEIDNLLYQKRILSYYEANANLMRDSLENDEKDLLDIIKEKIKSNESASPSSSVVSVKSTDPPKSEYPKILFLGTSSTCGSKVRNVSSILVKVNENTSVLLDCGEDTCGQLIRFFGLETYDDELIKIKAVFLSHSHLDHFGGVLFFLKRRLQALANRNIKGEKLYVLYPQSMFNFFNDANIFYEDQLAANCYFILNDYIDQTSASRFMQKKENRPDHIASINLMERLDPKEKTKAIERMKDELNLKSIVAIPVIHIIHSYGLLLDIKLKDEQSYKLVYSGDCRPTKLLSDIGKNCDVLIHECTFDNSLLNDAITKLHSTIAEALEISKKTNSKWTVLNHFSLRYGRFAYFDDINQNNTAYSFDFMYLTPQNLESLMETNPFIKLIFKEAVEENELKKSRSLNKTKKSRIKF